MSHQSDIKAVKQLANAWRAGWLAGDAKALMELYARNPVLMPQGQPAVKGKRAIRALYKAVLKEYSFESKSRLMEVEVSGGWAYFWSTYSLKVRKKTGGETFEAEGKSVFIVKREGDGRWRISRLMDNSDRASDPSG